MGFGRWRERDRGVPLGLQRAMLGRAWRQMILTLAVISLGGGGDATENVCAGRLASLSRRLSRPHADQQCAWLPLPFLGSRHDPQSASAPSCCNRPPALSPSSLSTPYPSSRRSGVRLWARAGSGSDETPPREKKDPPLEAKGEGTGGRSGSIVEDGFLTPGSSLDVFGEPLFPMMGEDAILDQISERMDRTGTPASRTPTPETRNVKPETRNVNP